MTSIQLSSFYGDDGKSAAVFYCADTKMYNVVFLAINETKNQSYTLRQIAEDAAEDWCLCA